MIINGLKKLFGIFFFLCVLCGCSNSPDAPFQQHPPKADKYGGSIILSTSSDPKSFNPIIAKETSTTLITNFIFEGLTETDGVTLKIKPCLAERWERDSSGKIWTFYLRKDVYWHNGGKFTADDVIFTFEQLIFNKKIPTSSRDVLLIDGKPIKVIKIDDYTIQFILPEKFAPFLRLLSQEILPEYLLKEKVKNGIFTSSWGVNEKPENIVGTGAFFLKDYRPGEWIILDRNPNYWKKDKKGNSLPYIERIVFLVVADHNMAILKFKSGEIDAVSINGPDYPILKPFEKKGNFTIYKVGPSLGSEFLIFNQNIKSPVPQYKIQWFRNKKFRQAVACTIDKESMIKNVLGGFGIPQDGPLNSSSGNYYNPGIKKYKYNLEKAKNLLKETGFFWKDKKLFDTKKHPVEFTILTNSNNSERIQITNIIQDDLKKLGINVNLLPIEFNTIVTRLSATRNWEVVLLGLTGGIEPHGGKNVWHSSGQLHMWNPSPGETITEWEKEIDELFEKGAQELNPALRKKIYDRWQEIISEQEPLIYTVNPLVMYAVRNKFGNVKPTVYGGIFHNIEEIYLKDSR